jgi:hypothetical protein
VSAFREYPGAFDEVVDSPPTGQHHGHPEETSNGHGKDGGRTAPLPANGPGKNGLKTPTRPPRITLIPFNQIRLKTKRRDLIKGLIPHVGLTVMWGPPKCGKSFWVFDAMMHVALGWDYRGRRVNAGPVVYCAFEGQTGIEARVAAFRQRFLEDYIDEVPFFLEPVTLDLVRHHTALIAAINKQVGIPVAVVLDTLNRSIRGSESSDEDMTAYITAADAVRATFNCAVVIVHHCGIDGTRPRGHTSLTGAVDAQLSAKRDSLNNVVVTVEWMKDGPEGVVITSALEVQTVGTDEDGESITSCVVVPAKAPPSGKSVPPSAKLALELLREAIDEEGAPGRTNGRVRDDVKAVPISVWKTYYFNGSGTHSDKPDSKRRAFDRAVEKLQQLQMIGVWKDVVWIA